MDTILYVAVAVLLIIYWRKRSAVWGGFTLGVIIGLIVAIVGAVKGDGFNWHIIGKGAVFATFFGFAAEMLGKVSDFLKRRRRAE